MTLRTKLAFIAFFLFVLTDVSLLGEGTDSNENLYGQYTKMEPLEIGDAQWTNGFWAKWFERCHQTMIPNMRDLMYDSSKLHALQNFHIAAGIKDGEYKGTRWIDGDFYKWLESVAYAYAVTNDENLDQLMDSVILFLN